MKGFTLLETLIYLAIFGLLMSGTLLASYQLTIDGGNEGDALAPEEEGDFVVQKIANIFSSMKQAIVASSSDITITAWDASRTEIALASGTIFLATNGGMPEPLNSSAVLVNDLQFSLIPAHGNVPLGVIATATINGIDFTFTHYAW